MRVQIDSSTPAMAQPVSTFKVNRQHSGTHACVHQLEFELLLCRKDTLQLTVRTPAVL